jgi:hypothetical protein|tara:strand:+ start:1861 stop:3354 length:1494 start_codon:yes stop_codon:yes gene_type:complete
MGDILNINSVVMCASILDMDTVSQNHILNVNSVPVNCGGNSWDCSSITIYDSCSGNTEASCIGCGGTPHYEQPMSNYFSDWGANQGLVTSDYYYLDYTAATNTLSCLIKGDPKRILLGWQLVNNGDALYASTAGLGITHNVWSSFISAMNATGIISQPTSLTSTQLNTVLSSLSPPSSYIPYFGACKCIYDCNCISISGSSGAYSSMTECLGDTTTCCGECDVKSVVELAHDKDLCETACNNTCSYYFTDAVSPIPCPMSLGDHIYIDTSCTPAGKGFYSPNNCDANCGYCYEVGSAGEIIAITLCGEDLCSVVELYLDSDGLPCPDGIAKCDDVDCNVCKFNNKFNLFTDAQFYMLTTIPILMVGDHLYPEDTCICESNSLANLTMGRYLWKDVTQGKEFCITLGHDCLITSKVLCEGVLPSSPPPVDEETEDETEDRAQESEDEGENGPYKPKKEWISDKEGKRRYYDEGGYRFYDENGDGIVDYSVNIGEKPLK